MSVEFERLFDRCRSAFGQERTFARAKVLAMSALVGLGRRTVSGMLCTSAQQFSDWSAAYRIFEESRFDREEIFRPVRQAVLERLDPREPLVAMMDDTLIRKRGRKVHGASWRRDPLGPAFATNFVWGQRYLQISGALPPASGPGQARGIPMDLIHAPGASRPRRNAPPEEWREYRKQQQRMRISAIGAERLRALRAKLDESGERDRALVVSVDGGFTNRTTFRPVPPNTILIGRLRKDARLFGSVVPKPRRGRPRWFGERLPTPEEMRQDDSIPWAGVEAFAAGKSHVFKVKTVSSIRWSGTGSRDVRLVIIAPLAYRARKGSQLLYRDPTYLICTSPGLPLSKLLQAYIWRWEIEVNFRDEKTLLGMGEAQVRTPQAVENIPSFIAAAYAFLLLSNTTDSKSSDLPPPKWYPARAHRRESTAHMIGCLRSQLWGKAMGLNITHFASSPSHTPNASLFQNSLSSAVYYAFK